MLRRRFGTMKMLPYGTIGSAQAAADAVIFDDDLEVLAAMDRIDRAARHAMRIGA